MAHPGLHPLYRTAFVTGASGGLGEAFARLLLREGVEVWGTARQVDRLQPLAREFSSFHGVALDLAERERALRALVEASEAAGGRFDLLVNNAGYGVFGEFVDTPFGSWANQLDAMLGTTLLLTHETLRRMRTRPETPSAIVNVSSLAVEFPLPYMSGYNVAKAGLSALSESLMFETHGSSTTVIDFRPGDYRTAFNDSMSPASASVSPRRLAAWRTLQANLHSAPFPDRAARDLKRALLRRRSGTVRTGSLFQARVAPLCIRLVPRSWVRPVLRWYFGVRS